MHVLYQTKFRLEYQADIAAEIYHIKNMRILRYDVIIDTTYHTIPSRTLVNITLQVGRN